MSFHNLNLDERLISILDAQQIVEPTPIQREAIPAVLEGRDIIGLAQTGTGKTLAFALPLLTRLARPAAAAPESAAEPAGVPKGKARRPSIPREAVLVLTPTRELAVQVHSVFEPLAAAVGMTSLVIYGGVSLEHQAEKLRKGRTVIVATPGRLLDHLHRGNVRFSRLRAVVLDEADRMLDMGFLPDIRRILQKIPRKRQTLMFSATFPGEIAHLAGEFMHEPQTISVGAVFKPVERVRQTIYPVNPHDKERLLCHVLETERIESALVFCRTRRRTEQLARALRHRRMPAVQIHGERTQKERERALAAFREGRAKILVATDVAARGLDIEGISHVINFDIPPTADDYIHRIGRTARADAEGDAITFVTPAEWKELETIEAHLGRNIPRRSWERAPEVLSLFSPRREQEKSELQKRQVGRPFVRSTAQRFGSGRRRR
ncbi:MAG: hypothetical protein Kow0059_16150 [Candidatus Sumerlaeia bacterium]